MTGRGTPLWRPKKRRWGRRVLLLILVVGLGWWWLGSHAPPPPDGSPKPASVESIPGEGPDSGSGGSQGPEQKRAPVPERRRILAVLPLSGPFAGQGERIRQGMELARKEWLPDGPQLDFLDGWQEPQVLEEKLARRLKEPDLYALLVHLPVERLEALTRRAASAGVVVVSVANTHQRLAADEHLLSFLGSDEAEAREAARLIVERYGKGDMTVVEEPSAYGTFFSSHFRRQAQERGLSVHRVVLNPGELPPPDLPKQSQKILLAGSPAWAADVVAALESAGYRGLYFVPHTFGMDYVADLFSGVMDRVRFVLPLTVKVNGESDAAFRQAYRRSYWKEPGWLSRAGYDCARWIAAQVGAAGASREAFGAGLLSGEVENASGEGVGGPFRLDGPGKVIRTYSLAALTKGVWVSIDQ
ncbi:ABC-type branched-chain amino acid transport system, substrate-binding protein [Desulfacinum hydrothermale DSM 13146]|uniref:ABC-type branched-chain amino acid transport system, substrate-binding protein n=1 Tax=Desulfacinum hydrothermale DSM 13146 TaxID=1121390 RepID=A0A1W1XMS1_9BACT|nr:ABC transporter substrate-binding protein [Desulfacinum hydrothermale]SMC25135.1 ABC-type branched-chain amino acid transport system, substrate-binding protein [Desulfacinum hydrothermale DSM 13146]